MGLRGKCKLQASFFGVHLLNDAIMGGICSMIITVLYEVSQVYFFTIYYLSFAG